MPIPGATPTATPTVYLVDDEPTILRSLARVLRASGFEAQPFQTAAEFVAQCDAGTVGCVLLDMSMPGGLDGLAVQQALADKGCTLPVIFLSGQSDVPRSVSAMKHGAADFLTKPVDSVVLLDAVRAALARDVADRELQAELSELRRRLALLTPREREVLGHVVSGQLNKQIASDLGTVEKTVKVHRSRVMEKLKVRSLAELVRLTERLGVAPSAHGR